MGDSSGGGQDSNIGQVMAVCGWINKDNNIVYIFTLWKRFERAREVKE